MSTGTGLLSDGVGVRLGEAGSLSIAVGVQSARVWVMCGRAGSCACTTGVLSPPIGSTILFEDRCRGLDTTYAKGWLIMHGDNRTLLGPGSGIRLQTPTGFTLVRGSPWR